MEFVTTDHGANEQLLYFTSSSLSKDNRTLCYLSDGGGHPNLWARDLDTGKCIKLSENEKGTMKSYVYFRGTPYRGLGKASMALDEVSGRIYYIQDQAIWSVCPGEKPRRLANLPAGQMTAFTHVSADGKYLCVPTTDERALEDEEHLPETPDGCGNLNHDIDERVQNENLASCLHVYDTETGEEVLCEKVPKCWITHVQFSPVDSSEILYNHEWPSDCGIRRMWLYKDGKHIRLRSADDGFNKNDWTCHEMWYPDGRDILYHGGYEHGAYYVGRVSKAGGNNMEYRLPANFTAYGHFTMANTNPDLLVTDGYYEENGRSGYISTVRVNWETGEQVWTPLCLHNSPWTTQDSHPHPIFDPTDGYVYFTGYDGQTLKVCRVKV